MSAQNASFSLIAYDYSNQRREARATGKMGRILRPPGGNCMLSGHVNVKYNKPQNQDRIYLPYRTAWRMRRAAGYVANIRYESSGKNASRQASAQVVIKFMALLAARSSYLLVRPLSQALLDLA